MHTQAHVRSALAEAEAQFMQLPNVRAIDYGIPRHGGVLAPDDRAIRIHVHRKMDSNRVRDAARHHLTAEFPPEIQGIPVDILELRPVRPQRIGSMITTSRRARAISDPLEGGVGVGPLATFRAGTLGAVVQDSATGRVMLLSNHHVLCGRPATQMPSIVQPSRLQGGTTHEVIGRTKRHALDMALDAAVADLNGSRRISVSQSGLGEVRGLARPQLGMLVQKSGLSSGVTSGVVTGLDAVVEVRSSGIVRRLRHAAFIEPEFSWREVSRAGDSGALWLNEEMDAVALHFAGSDRPEKAFAADLTTVLQALRVKLIVNPT